MRTQNWIARIAILLLGYVLCALTSAAAQSTQPVYALHGFQGSDGSRPNSLTQGADRNLYGTTARGGGDNMGVVYQIAPDGTFTSLHTFSGASDGAEPNSPVRDRQGNIWGIARRGGDNGNGIVFEITAGGAFRIAHTFSTFQNRYVTYPGENGATATALIYVNPDGAIPSALTVDSDGNVYGVTELGGADGEGTVFKLAPNGTFNVLHTFTLYTLTPGAAVPSAQISDFRNEDGGNPVNASLVVGADGALYGMTSEGGPGGFGTTFRITTGGSFTRLRGTGNGYQSIRVNPGPNGGTGISSYFDAFPASLRLGSDGALYGANGAHEISSATTGTTSSGLVDGGSLFRMTTTGATTVLYSFPTIPFPRMPGDPPWNFYDPSGLVRAADGTLYGSVRLGGLNGVGMIFKLAPDSSSATGLSPQTLYIPVAEGGIPENLLLASDGNLYGTGQGGGKNGDGSVWEARPTPLPFVIHSFAGPDGRDPVGLLQGKDGNLYGVARATTTGGVAGTIFTLTTDSSPINDTLRVLDYLHPGDPNSPNPGLIQARDGLFYGTSASGGGGVGGLFRVTAGGLLTRLYGFPGGGSAYGGIPSGGVIEGTTGKFYGTATYNGITPGGSGDGVVYSFTPGDIVPTILHTFRAENHGPGLPDDGYNPVGSLLLASDGRLYGATGRGGIFSNSAIGTLYSLDPNGAPPNYDFRVIHMFDPISESGNSPGGLVEGKDGALYGTLGALFYNAAVFKINKDGTGFQILHSFTFSEGSGRITPLLLAADGNFYGMIGGDGRGAIYRFASADDFQIVYRFSGPDGEDHYNGIFESALVQGTDGNLYGVAGSGGLYGYMFNPPYIDGFGTIFRLATAKPKATIPDAAADVTGQFTLATTGHTHVGGVHTYSMTLQNTGGALPGPLALVLDNLPAGTNLLNAAGNTSHALPASRPFVQITGGGLSPGAQITVILKTNKPLTAVVTKRILSGPGPF